jgi:hypothetical protein
MYAMKSLISLIIALVVAFPTVTYSQMTQLLCPLLSNTVLIPVKFDPDKNFVSTGDDSSTTKTKISDDAVHFEWWHIIKEGDTKSNPSRSKTEIDRNTRKFRTVVFDRDGKQMYTSTGVCKLDGG